MLNSPSNHRPQLCLSSLPLESGIQTLSNMAADVHAFGSHSEPINFETSWAEYSGNSAYLTYDDAPEVNCIMVIIVEISSLQQLRVEVANRLRASEYHIYPWSDLEKHGEVCKCCLKNHILSLFITEIGRQIYVSIHIYQFKMHEYVYIYIYIMYIIYIYIHVQTGSCSLFFRIPLFWDIRVLLSRQNVSCKHDRLHVTGIPPTFKMVKNPSMRRGLNTSWSRSPIQKAWSLEIPSLWITIIPKMFPRIRVQIR